jgi:hypothetical protein
VWHSCTPTRAQISELNLITAAAAASSVVVDSMRRCYAITIIKPSTFEKQNASSLLINVYPK